MRKRRYVLPAILLLLLLAQPTFSAVSQHLLFDRQGNLISLGAAPAALPINSSPSASSIPEGVVLRGGITYEYYPVYGATFSDIVKSVEENGPYDSILKKRLPTKIAWRFGISYLYDFSSAIDEEGTAVHVAVEVTDIRLTYGITLTLPSLIDNTSLNPIERNLWKNLWLRLLEHEYDHVDIIEDSGMAGQAKKDLAEINYLIFDYREGTDIDGITGAFLRDEAVKAAKAVSKTIQGKLIDYDTLTDYGNKHSLRDSFFRSTK